MVTMNAASVLLCCALVGCLARLGLGFDYNPNFLPPNCKACTAMSCPELIYCAGKKVMDNCGCCERCSSDLFQPHAPAPDTPPVDACMERKCPRFKVCIINIQGLPICTCPSKFVCDPNRKRHDTDKKDKKKDATICGSDDVTYESRCHMKVANCEKGKRIRRKHSGPCLTSLTTSQDGTSLTALPDPNISVEVQERLKAVAKVKRRRQKRKKMKDKKRRKKDRKNRDKRFKKNRDNRRRMKRRNHALNPYPNQYNKFIGKHTTWGRSTVRKSRI